jgi:glyoxylate carboligase
MKPGVGIVLCIAMAILLGTDLPAMSVNPSDLKNMTCRITTPDTKGCMGIPTLRSGVLTISKEGTFELKAHYDGCFFIEDVTTSGKFLASHFKNTMSLELLSTKTAGVKDTAGDFPRTLGFANLEYDKLNGYLVDFSAVIRGRGRHAKDVIASKLQCEVDE